MQNSFHQQPVYTLRLNEAVSRQDVAYAWTIDEMSSVGNELRFDML